MPLVAMPTVFKVIHMALGNENWNGGFTSQAIGFGFGMAPASTRTTHRDSTRSPPDMRAMPSYGVAQTELVMGVQAAGAWGLHGERC